MGWYVILCYMQCLCRCKGVFQEMDNCWEDDLYLLLRQYRCSEAAFLLFCIRRSHKSKNADTMQLCFWSPLVGTDVYNYLCVFKSSSLDHRGNNISNKHSDRENPICTRNLEISMRQMVYGKCKLPDVNGKWWYSVKLMGVASSLSMDRQLIDLPGNDQWVYYISLQWQC